ncbi:sulfatase [Bacteroides sp. 224]|uniref:sulfatase family protein n=1 Tax=Bacteroides sp. 224 TaxID=2302936 RepID=UPI0013D0FB3B|nr:sulfatase [Bacteroides sp. 224]NDV64134.1 sulfatase [Bacteroides sp. 224]
MKYVTSAVLLSLSSGAFSGCRVKEEPLKRPNILFVINDDQSYAHTSFAGCRFVKTPGFDRVASNGIYFENCYGGSPGSAPSRSALVTGRHHWQNKQAGQHASSWMKEYVPFVDLLASNGYHIGFTGKGVAPFQYARNDNDSLWRKGNAAGKPYNKHRYKKDDPSDPRTAGGIESINYYENFRSFLQQREEGQPFYFWYGSTEPHRAYEKGSWKRNGKNLDLVDVPDFLPPSEEVKGDMLDYAVEIEWADSHLCEMLNYLDSIGELDNTIVMVTADNGMPFPRAKANCFEYGVHVPMAISYPKGFPGKRRVSDPIGFADIAPTLLEMAGVEPDGMLPITGRSFVNILKSKKAGVVDDIKRYAYMGRERHSSSRWQNLGYPQRAVRSQDYLLVWNAKPERWPAGAPQTMNKETGELYPMYGVQEDGTYHRDWAFSDSDDGPSKAFLIEHYNDPAIHPYFELAFDKRPEFEIYHLENDPFCMENLAGKAAYASIEKELKEVLFNELKRSEDPRVVGPDKEVFESYIRYSGMMRAFPKPDWME